MVSTTKSPNQFREFVDDAGLGSMIWGRTSYRLARGYHYIIAAFTTLIMALTLLPHAAPAVVIAWIALYLSYVAVRKMVIRQPFLEYWFYRPHRQFGRALLGVFGITVVMMTVPGSEYTSLWVLYALVIVLASKHCNTERMLLIVLGAGIGLVAVRLFRGMPLESVLLEADFWADAVTLGLLAFVFHYLVRNIQARDCTIEAYRAINALAREVDVTDTAAARHWQPMLSVLLQQMNAEGAATWMIDQKNRRLKCTANVRRDGESLDWVEAGPHEVSLPIDSPAVVAAVARDGKFAYTLMPEQLTQHAICPPIAVELAVPINAGTSERPNVIGVLSVGFKAGEFQPRLLGDYQNFMLGLTNQSRPMLVYARRLAELRALQEASQSVWRSLDLEHVLDSILDGVVNTLGFEFATLSLVDDERQLIRSVRGKNVPQKWLDMAAHPLASNDIQAITVRTGRTEIVVGQDQRFDQRMWRRFNHKELVRIFMPIEVVDAQTGRARIIGTLEAGYRRAPADAITPDQQRLLETFISQVAMAIAHTNLLRHTQKRADTLTSLHKVGQAIGSARQAQQVLRDVARQAKDLLGASVVIVYPRNRVTNKLDTPIIAGDTGRALRLNLTLGRDSVLARLLSESQPHYSADARHDPLLNHIPGDAALVKPTFTQWHSIKSLAGLPLIAHGETVGLMFVNYRQRHQFDVDEKQVHELFAQQAAVAIQNAEINELQRDLIIKEERNHLSHDLHHLVSQALYGIDLKANNALDALSYSPAQVRAELLDIRDITQLASNETGFIIDELRAPVETSRYFEQGLEEYAQRIRQWYRINVLLERNLSQPLRTAIEPALLRFAREGIINAARHARCETITIGYTAYGSRVEVVVRDDGIGFDPERVPRKKLGLRSLQELATSMGGLFAIKTAPGAGTEVSLVIFLDNNLEERSDG